MELVTKYKNKEDDRVVTVKITPKWMSMKDEILEVPKEIYNLCNFNDIDIISMKKQLDTLLNFDKLKRRNEYEILWF